MAQVETKKLSKNADVVKNKDKIARRIFCDRLFQDSHNCLTILSLMLSPFALP